MSRFHLRHLLGLVAIVSIAFNCIAARTRQQREIVRCLRARGSTAFYASSTVYSQFAFYEFGTSPHVVMETVPRKKGLDAWVGWIDVDLGDCVTGVDLGSRHQSLADLGEAESYPAWRVVDSQTLGTIASLPYLEWLGLEGAIFDRDCLAELSCATKVRYLNMCNTNVQDRDLRHVAELKELEDLVLDGTDIGDRGLEYVCHLSRLRHLSLSGTKVTDDGVLHLRQLARLEVLDLSDTQLSDEGMRWLAALSALRELRANRTNITNRGVYELRDMPQLQRIYVHRTAVAEIRTLGIRAVESMSPSGSAFRIVSVPRAETETAHEGDRAK